MNLLTIIILLVLLVFAINGYMRGFARTLTSLFDFEIDSDLIFSAFFRVFRCTGLLFDTLCQ